MQEIKGEIERVWNAVKDLEFPNKKSESTLLEEAEMRTIIAIREALNATPPRIGYLDPTSEWSIWHALTQIKGILPIPTSEINFDTANQHRPLFDNEFRKLLDRETRLLVTYRVLSAIKHASIFEIEKMDETIDDLNRKIARIYEIGLDLEELQDDINFAQQKEEIIYTDKFKVPPTLLRCWPVYRATYPAHLKHIPISSWSDTVEKGTKRIKVSYEGDSKFPVISFQAHLFAGCKGKVVYYVKSLDLPATKVQLERQIRWRDILIEERRGLLETSKGQKQKVEERRSDLFTIAHAHRQVSSMMNHTREGQIKEYKKLVIRLWNTSGDGQTGIRQIDNFLLEFKEYRRSTKYNREPGSLTIGDISRLASYARAWLERDDL
jgi:hypothetical protein